MFLKIYWHKCNNLFLTIVFAYSEMPFVRIRTADENVYRTEISENDTLSIFLSKINEISKIPVNEIRLLFNGKEVREEGDFENLKKQNGEINLLLARKNLNPVAFGSEPESLVMKKYKMAWTLADNCERNGIYYVIFFYYKNYSNQI